MSPVTLPNPSLEPVSLVRFSDLFRHGDSESTDRPVGVEDEDDRVAAELLAALLVNAREIGAAGNSLFPGERLTRGRDRISRSHGEPSELLELDGETLAAFAAATRENGLAILGPHTDEKSVRPLATAVVRLKSTLCHDLLP